MTQDNDTLSLEQEGEVYMPARLCPYCKVMSNFSRNRNQTVDAGSTPFPRNMGSEIALDQCQNCNAFVYVRTNNNGTEVFDQYPKNVETAPNELPPDVKKAFSEALVCYSASAPNGAALMCRRAIQETMTHFHVPKGNLPTQLQWLDDKRIITPYLREWGDHARIAGALAGHGTHGEEWGDPSKVWVESKDAEAVIDFCQSFFEYLFVMPERNRIRRAATGTQLAEP